MTAFNQVFDAKVFGTVSMTKSSSPLLMKAKGTICNIGSMATYFFCPINGVYAGANLALEYVGHQMRMESEPFGVSVVHVSSPSLQFPTSQCANRTGNRRRRPEQPNLQRPSFRNTPHLPVLPNPHPHREGRQPRLEQHASIPVR
jgi:short-subunit dehydrogenase